MSIASAVKAAERASVALEESQGDVPSSQRAEILRETALVQANIAIAQALIALAVGPEIGSENWVKAQIAAKLYPEESDRPRG